MEEQTIGKVSIDQLLNEVSYSDDDTYIPSEFAIRFINFIKLVNGKEGEENKSPVLHYRMLDALTKGEKEIANMLFRGSAKTTLFCEYMILYLAVYHELPGMSDISYGIYVSDSIDNGVKSARKNIEYRWQNSDFLQTYLPKTKFTDVRWEFTNIDGETLIFKGFGARTGVRGTKELGKRPTIALLDDLISDEDARSETVIASIEATVDKAINFALHPTRKLTIWNGTPFNAKDPLYKTIESGAWFSNVYPLCEKFPCSREEFRGAWEDRFDYDYAKREYDKFERQGKVHAFNQELMLRIMSEKERLITDNDIIWYNNRHIILQNKHRYHFYITTDLATSDKDSGDYSVISVWAVTHKKEFYWVDGIVKRQTMDKNFNDLFRLVQMYNPLSVGVEVSGQQKGLISLLQDEMLEKNIFFHLASDTKTGEAGIRPTTSKFDRFSVTVPWFKMKKIRLPAELKDAEEMREAYNELSLVTEGIFKSKHDDWLDTVSMLALMTISLPAEHTAANSGDYHTLEPWEVPPSEEEEDGLTSYIA